MNSATTTLTPNTWTVSELENYLQENLITDSVGRQWRLTLHPAAKILPRMAQDVYTAFKVDIHESGQKQPISVVNFTESQGTYTGELIDGINRLGGSIELGLQPKIETTTTGDPLETVLSLNVTRRHLEKGQRAAMAATLASPSLGLLTSVGKNYTVPKAAKKLGVGRELVERFITLHRHAPDLADRVRSGESTMNKAYEEYQHREKAKYALLEPSIWDHLCDLDPGLAVTQPQLPVSRYSPAPAAFLADLKFAIVHLKSARIALGKVSAYLHLRSDFEIASARGDCDQLASLISRFVSETSVVGIMPALRRVGLISEPVHNDPSLDLQKSGARAPW